MRPTTTAAPAAIAGSIALMFSGAPAQAAETSRTLAPVTPTFTGAAAALTVRPSATTPPETHVVQGGDTVWGIATRYGLRTADVLALNGLTPDSIIRPGQVLALVGAAPTAPVASAPAATAVVTQGDTLSGIAQRHGVSLAALFEANGLGYGSIIYPGQTVVIPGAAATPPAAAPPAASAPPAAATPPAAASHTVQAGDTVWAIAQRHGVAMDAVLAANGLTAASVIHPGQVLTIPSAAMTPAAATTPVASTGLDAEQVGNVQLIVRIGRELGVSDRGIAIALGTAMQESWLRNLDWGDRDSLGLFQQRPSTGWGTAEEVRDPVRATKAFFGGPADPNGARTRGLLDIPDWEGMAYADAAQAVQISAYPERYARWEQPAYAWLAAHG